MQAESETVTRRLQLQPGPEGLAHARGAVSGLEHALDPGVFFDVSLCVNELITNAIRAVDPDRAQAMELEVGLADGALRVAVKDHGGGAERLERIVNGDGESDFGLYIIS